MGATLDPPLLLLILGPSHGASIAFLITLQWKCENLLGEKQSKFTETGTPRGLNPHVILKLSVSLTITLKSLLWLRETLNWP